MSWFRFLTRLTVTHSHATKQHPASSQVQILAPVCPPSPYLYTSAHDCPRTAHHTTLSAAAAHVLRGAHCQSTVDQRQTSDEDAHSICRVGVTQSSRPPGPPRSPFQHEADMCFRHDAFGDHPRSPDVQSGVGVASSAHLLWPMLARIDKMGQTRSRNAALASCFSWRHLWSRVHSLSIPSADQIETNTLVVRTAIAVPA